MINLTPIYELRKNGRHTEAKEELVRLAAQFPDDPQLQYESACVHDFLGLERKAVPYYIAAIRNGLAGKDLRGAYLGLGSTYRTLGMYEASKQTFVEGLTHFPEATEIKVFFGDDGLQSCGIPHSSRHPFKNNRGYDRRFRDKGLCTCNLPIR